MAKFKFPTKEELIVEARKQMFRYMSVVNSICNEIGNNESKHDCVEYKKKEKRL